MGPPTVHTQVRRERGQPPGSEANAGSKTLKWTFKRESTLL
jgi:hypothetical protein